MASCKIPPNLKDLCFEKVSESILGSSSCVVKPQFLCKSVEGTGLPISLSQELFDFCIKRTASDDVNRVLRFFSQVPLITPLQRLHLENSKRADLELVQDLVRANTATLTHLDIRGCHGFPKTFWHYVNETEKLHTLVTTDLLVPLRCAELKVLVVDWKPRKVLQRVCGHFMSTYYDSLLENVLPNLRYLDLSWCPWVKKLKTLELAKNLEVLLLRNTNVSGVLSDIVKLEKLRVLDISIGIDQDYPKNTCGKFVNPGQVLKKLVTSLTLLEHLNISGTNLVEVRKLEHEPGEEARTPALEYRRQNPLKFLGVYSFTGDDSYLADLPAYTVAAECRDMMILESIKMNRDMPRTFQDQLQNLRSLSQFEFIQAHADSITMQMIKVLKNLRNTELYFPFWSLNCLQFFIEHILSPNEKLNEELEVQIFLALNRLIYSYADNKRLPEVLAAFLFQILTDLLSSEKRSYGNELRREVIRLSDFVLSLGSMTFVYLRTEVTMYRLLHRISLIPDAAVHLGENRIILMFFGFFRTLQIYLGFSLSLQQISKIVVTMWNAIRNFLVATPLAVLDLLKHNGLSWMNAHLYWFKDHSDIVTELVHVFKTILSILEGIPTVANYDLESKPGVVRPRVSPSARERILRLKKLIEKC